MYVWLILIPYLFYFTSENRKEPNKLVVLVEVAIKNKLLDQFVQPCLKKIAKLRKPRFFIYDYRGVNYELEQCTQHLEFLVRMQALLIHNDCQDNNNKSKNNKEKKNTK
jgi:Cu/Ag efflux pump CusA